MRLKLVQGGAGSPKADDGAAARRTRLLRAAQDCLYAEQTLKWTGPKSCYSPEDALEDLKRADAELFKAAVAYVRGAS